MLFLLQYASDVLQSGGGEGKAELDMLAGMLGRKKPAANDNFKLNLFQKAAEPGSAAPKAGLGAGAMGAPKAQDFPQAGAGGSGSGSSGGAKFVSASSYRPAGVVSASSYRPASQRPPVRFLVTSLLRA